MEDVDNETPEVHQHPGEAVEPLDPQRFHASSSEFVFDVLHNRSNLTGIGATGHDEPVCDAHHIADKERRGVFRLAVLGCLERNADVPTKICILTGPFYFFVGQGDISKLDEYRQPSVVGPTVRAV